MPGNEAQEDAMFSARNERYIGNTVHTTRVAIGVPAPPPLLTYTSRAVRLGRGFEPMEKAMAVKLMPELDDIGEEPESRDTTHLKSWTRGTSN